MKVWTHTKKAMNVVKSTFYGFFDERCLYSFLYRQRKHMIHQYLHDYGLLFRVHKIMYIS